MPAVPDDAARAELLAHLGLAAAAPDTDGTAAGADAGLAGLAQLAATLCETPIAVIELNGSAGRRSLTVYGANAGTDGPALRRWVAALTADASAQREPTVLEDAHLDARFDPRLDLRLDPHPDPRLDPHFEAQPDSPLDPQVEHPADDRGLRFCAVVRVLDDDGDAPLGTLAVFDRRPRRLAAAQLDGLQALAAQLSAQRRTARRARALEDVLLRQPRTAVPAPVPATLPAPTSTPATARDEHSGWLLLFERNPLPMWIFDTQTLRFLAVNEAATAHYGWSRDEFLTMTLRDIRPAEDVPALLDDLAEGHDHLHGGVVWRHCTKSGQLIHVDITAHTVPFEGRDGRLVMAHDVSERMLAAEALRNREARWERLFAASATGIASAASDGRFISVNPAFCALVGRNEAALRGRLMLSFTHPDDLAHCRDEMERLQTGAADNITLEKRYLRPDGTAVWARAAVAMMPPEARRGRGAAAAPGDEPHFIAVVQNIDESRAAQQRLHESHALIAMAGRLARVGGWTVTLPQQQLQWSDELLQILGYTADHPPSLDEAIGWYQPPYRERLTQALDACLAEGVSFDIDLEMTRAGRESLAVRVLGEAVRDEAGRITGAHGALHDHTERRRAMQAVEQSEQRFRHVARATADAIWDWNLLDDRLWWSDGMTTLFGLPSGDMGPGVAAWAQQVHPDDVEGVKRQMQSARASGAERWSAQYRFRRGDGSEAIVLDRGFVVRDGGGVEVRIVGGMSDLTTQHAAGERLRRQAQLLEAVQDAITVVDLDGRVTDWNHGAERIFGWRSDEAVGRVLSDLLREDPAVAASAISGVLARGEWHDTVRCHARDGRAVIADARCTLLRDAAGQPTAILSIRADATQRVALQSQLQQSQRLEAVGQLTGGVAHDFNNLLTVILGNADLLTEQLVDRPELLPLAEMTRTAAERGAELTHRLLAFARKQALQPHPVDAHHLLANMDALLRRTLPENIELELVRAAGLWPALADPVQLESAVLNLVLNARDAMPDGGKITLETGNAWIDQDYAERHADVLPGQYVLLSVSDTGTGIDAARLARVFEPFFTTKGVGVGSGLGLSMVYGFVKQSRGHVKLYSEPGHGTTARLYLPRADAPAAAVAAATPRGVHDLRGFATVLVVEDDPLVLRHASDLLVGLGYRVLEAGDGAMALRMLREHADIELLFTDVVMPGGLNGRQLAEAAVVLKPGLKVLYTSGYTENAIVHHGRLDRGVHLLPKPYRSVDLARKVMAVLAAELPAPPP